MANKDDQKKFRQSQKQKGLVELRGIWCKPENTDKLRNAVKSYQRTLGEIIDKSTN